MSAKGKLIRNSIIAAIALALLAAAYIFAVNFEPKTNDTDNGEYTDNTIKLFSTKSDSIKSVKFSLPDANYTLVQSDEGKVSIPELGGVDFEQNRLISALLTYTSVNAEREVEADGLKLSDFGLADKDSYFTITLRDGNQHTFYVGSTVPGGGGCYLKKSDSDKVYIMSEYFAETIAKSPNSYRSTDIFAIDAQKISGFSVTRGGKTIIKARLASKGEKSLGGIAEDWIMEAPYRGEGASVDKISTFLQGLEQISAVDFADNSSPDTYGLGNTKTTLSVTASDGKTSSLYLGNMCDKGVYVMTDKSTEVYIADSSVAQTIDSIDAINFISKLVRVHNIADVKTIDVSKDGKAYTLEIDQSKADDAADKYKINGKATPEKAFKEAYQKVIGVFFVDYADVTVSTPFMTITYKLANGSTDSLKFYEYNERYYVVKRQSGQCLTVLKTTLNELINLLD